MYEELAMYIDGEWCQGSDGAGEDVINPATEEKLARLPHASTADLDRALASVDPERALILLAHDPTTFKQASRRGVDLQLSGHTHGGQIWPFGLFVKLAVPFVAGLYRRGGATLYVSRGTGFWGPPMRLRSPSEITEIVLRASTDAQSAEGLSAPTS